MSIPQTTFFATNAEYENFIERNGSDFSIKLRDFAQQIFQKMKIVEVNTKEKKILKRRIKYILEQYRVEIFQRVEGEKNKEKKEESAWKPDFSILEEAAIKRAAEALEALIKVDKSLTKNEELTDAEKLELNDAKELRIQRILEAAKLGVDVRDYYDFDIAARDLPERGGLRYRYKELREFTNKIADENFKIYDMQLNRDIDELLGQKMVPGEPPVMLPELEMVLEEPAQWALKKKEKTKEREVLRQEKLKWMQCLLKGESTPVRLCKNCTRPFIFIDAAPDNEKCIQCAKREDKNGNKYRPPKRWREGWQQQLLKSKNGSKRKAPATAAAAASSKKSKTTGAAAATAATAASKPESKTTAAAATSKPKAENETFSEKGKPDNKQHDVLEFVEIVLKAKNIQSKLPMEHAVAWPITEASGITKFTNEFGAIKETNPNNFLLVVRAYKENGDQTDLPLTITHPTLTNNETWKLTNIALYDNKVPFKRKRVSQRGHYISLVRTGEDTWCRFLNTKGFSSKKSDRRFTNNDINDQKVLEQAYIMLYTPKITYTHPKKITGLGATVRAKNGVPPHKNTCYAAAGVHLLRGMTDGKGEPLIPMQAENKSDYSYWETFIGNKNV